MKLKILRLRNKFNIIFLEIVQFCRIFFFKFGRKNTYLIVLIIILLGFFTVKKVLAESLKNEKNIIITEIMYNPEGKSSKNSDWIEIFAKDDFIVDKNWRVFDEYGDKLKRSKKTNRYLKCHSVKNAKNKTLKKDELFKIKKGDYIIFADNVKKFKKRYPNYKGEIFDTILNLQARNKDAVMISLDNCLSFTEIVEYEPKKYIKIKGYSLEWDFKNKKWRNSYILNGTPGRENSKRLKSKKYSKNIRINELLPNPEGDEKNNEFIELYNFGKNDVNLEGWLIKDNSKNGQFIFPKNAKIKSGKYFVIYRSDYKFALNNSGGEKVFLLNPNGKKVFKINYKTAKENISYGFDENNKEWRWSNKLTPGKNNLFSLVPKIKVKIGKKKYKNIYINFKVDVENIKNNKFKVRWSFGDGRRSYKRKTRHKYLNKGNYNGFVEILNEREAFKKEFQIEVKKFPHKKVKITALMPNPKGKDSEFEWIEIKNQSRKRINLKNWSIATGLKKGKLINHPIYDKIVIEAGKSKKITRKFSSFSLNNKNSIVELRYPDGKVAYRLKYKNKNGIKDGDIYKKNKGGRWFWLKTISVIDDKKKNNNIQKNSDINIRNSDNKKKEYNVDKNEKNFYLENNDNKEVLIKQFFLKKNKPKSINLPLENDSKVLGVWDSSIKKVRNDNGIYYFTPKTKKQEYYLKTFWNNIILRIKKYLIGKNGK